MRSCCEGSCAARTPNVWLRKHDIMVGCLSGKAHARLVPLTYGPTQLVVYIDIVCSVIISSCLSDGDAEASLLAHGGQCLDPHGTTCETLCTPRTGKISSCS
jgi:hypothetical protein